MKRSLTFIALFILLSTGSIRAQRGQQVNNIAGYAKLWGFMKYYHSEVLNGSLKWDDEFFRSILTIKKLESNEAYNQFVIRWYKKLPKAELDVGITQPDGNSILRSFDEHDIKKFEVPSEIRTDLIKMYQYHRPDSSKYISNVYGKYTLDYVWHNEEMYAKPAYPDEAHRLLALVRYWNIINYFYPHKLQLARHWDKVLTDFIPQFIAAANADEYRRAFLKLTAQLKDSHSFFSQSDYDKSVRLNAAFPVRYVQGKYVIGISQYQDLMEGLQAGDEIAQVNGTSVREREAELAPFTTGTNDLSYHRNIGQSLFKIDTNRIAQVGVVRDGKLISKQIRLYSYAELYQYWLKHQPKQLWRDMGNGIWYVQICSITSTKQLQQMFRDVNEAKSVIFDMRDYPNYLIVQAMWPGLVPKRVVPATNYNAVLFHPGAFKAESGLMPAEPDTLNLPLYQGKLIVLVNEFTQSLAESVAAELRLRPNTITVGRQTAGTTGNIVRVDYPGGIEASYTTVKTVGLNKSFMQGKGVKLDKKIRLSVDKMRSATDYELEQAYREAL